MSEENVELARLWLQRLNGIGRSESGALDPEDAFGELWQQIDAEAELHGRPDVPDSRIYRGRDGFAQFLRMINEVFSEIRWEEREFIDCGEAVAVIVKVVAVGRGSDVPVEMDEADVLWFREGKLIRVAGYPSKEQALEAASV